MALRIKRRFLTLSTKTTAVIICLALLLASASVYMSYTTFVKVTDEQNREFALNIAKTAASFIDGDKIEGYLETLTTDEAYDEMHENFARLGQNSGITFLYIESIFDGKEHYIMDSDTSELALKLGDTEPRSSLLDPYTYEVENGLPIESIMYNKPKYGGWYMSSLYPIHNSEGKCVAYVFSDMSINDIRAERNSFLYTIILIMLLLILAFAVVIMTMTRMSLVVPIERLTRATDAFVSDRANRDSGSQISLLDIRTGDEIEHLAHAIQTMETEINQYIYDITSATQEKERISTELSVGAKIQLSMLPLPSELLSQLPDNIRLSASMTPAKEVGGDFYDFFMIDEDNVGLVIADVSGKGVPAALFMVISKTVIKNYALFNKSPMQILANANEVLCQGNDEQMFVTAFMAVINLKTGIMTYSNAGHNPPAIRRANGDYQWLNTKPAFVLAGFEGTRFAEMSTEFGVGDTLYLFTDGVTEATDVNGELFGEERLLESLNKHKDKGVDELLAAIRTDVDTFVDIAPQFDDITMSVFTIDAK